MIETHTHKKKTTHERLSKKAAADVKDVTMEKVVFFS